MKPVAPTGVRKPLPWKRALAWLAFLAPFFFTTYEALHERLGQTNLFTVPSASVRQGVVAAAIRPFLESFPLPNGQAFGTTRGEYSRIDERKTDENYIMGRIDHQLAPGSQLFVRYTLECEGHACPTEAQISEREDATRAKITAMFEVDIRRADPLGQRDAAAYGTVISAYCAVTSLNLAFGSNCLRPRAMSIVPSPRRSLAMRYAGLSVISVCCRSPPPTSRIVRAS